MYIFENCVEEIALEGLDGITLNSLWIRLKNRRDFEYNLNFATKQYLWRYIRQHNEFNFYLLPEPRADISVNEMDDIGGNEPDLYPLCVLNQGWGPKDDPNTKIWGSCKHFDVRKDITNEIKTAQDYNSLEHVNNRFGNSFVIVASKSLRVKSLIGPCLDVETFLHKYVQSSIQYVCLERIGRSRYKGESSLGKMPLQVAFNLRPKDMFYVLKRLERFGVIKKQTYSVMIATKLRYGSISTLTRFFSHTEPNFYFGKMKELIRFLDSQPEKKAKGETLRNALNLERKAIKKLLQTYPGVVDRLKLNEPNVRFFQYFENQQQSAVEVEEISDTDSSNDDMDEIPVKKVYKKVPPKATIIQKYYQLSGKIVFNEETGEWKKVDEEDEEESDEEVDALQMDWIQKNPFRTRLYEMLRVIREAKSNGIIANDLRKKLSLGRKETDRLLNNAKRTDLIKIVMLNCGKLRKRLYVWACEQHESSADFDKFTQLTSIKMEDISEKEKLIMGERNVRRMNTMMTLLEEYVVLQRFELLKNIKAAEKEEGYKFEMDRKCIISLIDFLAAHDAVRCYTTVLISGGSSAEKEINFVCHRSIDPNHETLRLHIASVQQTFGHSRNKKGIKTDTHNIDEENISGRATAKAKKRKSLNGEQVRARKKPRLDNNKILIRDELENNEKPTLSSKNQRKNANDSLAEEIASIMTYNLSAQETYGIQGKFVRCQILHEFLYYWLFDYRGRLIERSTLSKNEDEREPDVYLDEESWKRYVPPPQPIRDNVRLDKWFLVSDLVAALPVSIIAMTCTNPYKIDGLVEILSHPRKKHYLLCQLPKLISLALQRDRRVVYGLARNCMMLSAVGILSLGPVHASSTLHRLEDTYFYLHQSTSLLDTSTTPYRFYHVAQPLSRYQEYNYEFTSQEVVEIYWLHFRAICFSSRMGHRNCKTQEDADLEKFIKTAKKSIRDLCQIKRTSFELVTPAGKPVESPRGACGACGYHPVLVTFRFVNWKLNRSLTSVWFFDEMRRRMVQYEKEIAKRVASLSLSWNTFLNVNNEFMTNVTRTNYKSPFAKSSRHILRNPRHDRVHHTDADQSVILQKSKSEGAKRKADPFLDNVDKLSFESKRRLRSRFTLKEGQTMLLARAVSLVVCPNQKMWVKPTCVRDLMHKYVPESRDKTAKSMLQRSARVVYDNQASYDSMMMMVNQLKKNLEIKAIKKCYPMISFCSPQQKLQLYTQLFEKAIEIFSSGSSMLLNEENLKNVLENYTLVYESQDKDSSEIQNKDVTNLDSVYESAVFNTYLSLLSLSRRDGTFSAQLHEIYKGFPRDKMNSVVSQLKRDGLIVTVLPHRVYAKQTREHQNSDGTSSEFMPAAGGLRRHLTFSYFYRHFFYHKFHINFTQEAVNFYHLLQNCSDKYHDILTETPGFVPVIVNLICYDQVDIRMKLPDVIVAISEENQSMETNENVLNKKQRRDSDDSDDDETGNAKLLKPPSFAGLNLNKTFLYKLRYERLQAVEKSDFRSINMRLSSNGLNPSEISVKYRPSPESFDFSSFKKISTNASENLLRDIPNDAPNWNEYKTALVDNDFNSCLIQIYDKTASFETLGIPESDLKGTFSTSIHFDAALKQLINDWQIIKCGRVCFRYVAKEFSSPWTVTSFKMPKELRSCVDDAEIIETKGKPVTFLPRPWLRPDGSLNRPMLKWLCEGIFLRVLSVPGITETDVCEQFNSVLQPTSTKELLEYMVNIGCVIQRIDQVNQRKPTLFGWTEMSRKLFVSYHVAIDGITKLAALFTQTPLPDFCSYCSSGKETVLQQKNVFSRRCR